mgnify:CR=1 FL=1
MFYHFNGPYRTDGIAVTTANTAFPDIKSSLTFGDALNRTVFSTSATFNASIVDIKL